MRWPAPQSAIAAVVCTGALSIGGCFGGGAGTGTNGSARASRSDGLVEVQTITYSSSFDGRRVRGTVAIPRAARSRGCVLWQDGQGSHAESSAAWQAFASLGLTTVSIEFRHQGARASRSAELDLVRGTVADLRSEVDYVEEQPYCRRNVAYAGVGLGGMVGTLLAAGDERVKAAVLAATPGTFRAGLPTRGKLAAAARSLSHLDPVRFVGRISPRPVLILSGLDDPAIPLSNARQLQAAARRPKTIVEYHGGADPYAGPAAADNGEAVTSFLLRYLVEPAYGISGSPKGTFIQR